MSAKRYSKLQAEGLQNWRAFQVNHKNSYSSDEEITQTDSSHFLWP